MAAKRQPIQHSTTVSGAVSDAFSALQSLGEELREWYDNLPEGLQGGSKGDALSEAADILEGLSEPDVPDSVAEVAVNYSTLPSRRQSRRERRDEAVQLLAHAVDALQESIDNAQSELNDLQSADETEANDAAETALQEIVDEGESARDEIQQVIDEAEGVEFPGMYS